MLAGVTRWPKGKSLLGITKPERPPKPPRRPELRASERARSLVMGHEGESEKKTENDVVDTQMTSFSGEGIIKTSVRSSPSHR